MKAPLPFSSIKPNERRGLLLSVGYFFFLLLTYYFLRPLREEMAIRGELDQLPWLWTGTTLVMLLSTPLFATLASRFPRRRFIPLTYRFFSVNLVLLFVLFHFLSHKENLWLGYLFYIWLSVFNLFAVSVFWSFMADIWNSDQGRRLFGFISVGGTVGAILGSSIPAYFVGHTGILPLFLLAAFTLEISVLCFLKLVKHFGLDQPQSQNTEPTPKIMEGFRLVGRSPYLLLMCVCVLLFTSTSASLYFAQAHIVKASFTSSIERAAVFGQIDFWVNIVTLITELFVTGPLLRGLGVVVGMCALPLVSVFGFSALAWAPTIPILVTFVILRRSLLYAIDRPSREVLFTVLPPDAKYKSKNFIDTFVYRAGDLSGAWITKIGASVAFTALPITVLWFALSWVLGKRHAQLAKTDPSGSDRLF